jgi:phosphoribosylamine--glycine ligase
MKVLLVGNRAIQHALEVRLRYEGVDVHVYPGQRFGGYACVNAEQARDNSYDLIIIGSPRYINDPIIKTQAARGAKIFGPDSKSMELESSKDAFKRFSAAYGIPTPPSRTFTSYVEALDYVRTASPPFVIKADGPARGCGVSICESIEDAAADLDRKLRDKGSIYYCGKVLIEQYVAGFEVAINILVNASGYLALPPTRPHKRRNNGDTGQIVAGMGSFAPVKLNSVFYQELHSRVLLPTFRGMRAEGCMFAGCLFVNLMVNNEEGITVLEFNCRMGDPAMLTSLMLIRSRVSELLSATVEDRLAGFPIAMNHGVALAVTLVDHAYPDGMVTKKRLLIPKQDWLAGDRSAGLAIAGVEQDNLGDGKFVVNSGVVACAVSHGASYPEAEATVYAIAARHSDLYFRTDVGTQVTPPTRYQPPPKNERAVDYAFQRA